MKFSLVSCFGKDGYSNHKETNIFQREKETFCEKPKCATPFLIDKHGVSVRECGPPHVLAADPHVVALPEKRSLFEEDAFNQVVMYSNCANVHVLLFMHA